MKLKPKLRKPLRIFVCWVAVSITVVADSYAEPISLPPMGADLSQTSVSGLSSGAFMTSQYYIAFSDVMVGAGIVAGGPYYCSGSWALNTKVENATTTCMNPLTNSVAPNIPVLVHKAEEFSEKGTIDPLENLANDRIYMFSGQSDEVVTTRVVDTTESFYKEVGVPPENIFYDRSVDAGHAIITDNNDDVACELTEPPFINDCDFVQSHVILNHIYEGLNPPSLTLSGEIIEFDQSEFIESSTTSMSDIGYLYVPAPCHAGACKVHVVFHGCLQGVKVIGDDYYTETGYNEIADSNEILVLYPQVEPSDGDPLNPEGCWDFWGYSSPDDPDPDFYSKNAPQLSTVNRMVQRLGEKRSN